MITVKCTYGNGDTVTTSINATLYEARAYFLGQWFNLGAAEDNMQQCVAVDLLNCKACGRPDDHTVDGVCLEYPGPCWSGFCIASFCNGREHVDATGHAWTEEQPSADDKSFAELPEGTILVRRELQGTGVKPVRVRIGSTANGRTVLLDPDSGERVTGVTASVPVSDLGYSVEPPNMDDGTSGQDRESYTDDQDRESYTVDEDEMT